MSSPTYFADAAPEAALGPAEAYEEGRWYACYTRARHEKRVDAALAGQGIETYLPLVAETHQWKDRKKRVELPLFPGYLFSRFRLGEVHTVLTTPGVSTIVRTGSRPVPIPDRDIENVRRFAAALGATGGRPPRRDAFVAEGDRVRVTDGPFRGVEGRVVETRGRHRVLVGLEAIRQGFAIDIDAARLEPLGRSRSAHPGARP